MDGMQVQITKVPRLNYRTNKKNKNKNKNKKRRKSRGATNRAFIYIFRGPIADFLKEWLLFFFL